MPTVVICAINGMALGFGLEIALGADIRIAAESARFAFPEVRRGLFETNGVTYFLPRLVGYGRALHMMLTGGWISSDQALHDGLVTRVVADEDLRDAALGLATTIAQDP